MHNILVVAGDPGGANALVPVIDLLIQDPCFNVSIYAYNEAYDIWSKKYDDVSDILVLNSVFFISEIFSELKIEFLLTGTSCNQYVFESDFILEAKKKNIPTLSLLDFWSSYKNRFFSHSENEDYLPDKIAVMDELCSKQMVSEGFNKERIVVTGQPAFDLLKETISNFSVLKRKSILEYYSISEEDFLIVFVSQPFTEIYKDKRIKIHNFGFKELDILNLIIADINLLSKASDKKIKVIICPHPREKIEKFDSFLSEDVHLFVKKDLLDLSKTINSKDLVLCSDLVIGINSILLMESCYLKKIAISYQPSLMSADSLPTNELGYTIPVYSKNILYGEISKYILDHKEREIHLKKLDNLSLNNSSAKNVVNLIKTQIEENGVIK